MPIKNGHLKEKYRHNSGKSFEKSYLVSVIFALSLGAMRPFDDAFYWRALLFAVFSYLPISTISPNESITLSFSPRANLKVIQRPDK